MGGPSQRTKFGPVRTIKVGCLFCLHQVLPSPLAWQSWPWLVLQTRDLLQGLLTFCIVLPFPSLPPPPPPGMLILIRGLPALLLLCYWSSDLASVLLCTYLLTSLPTSTFVCFDALYLPSSVSASSFDHFWFPFHRIVHNYMKKPHSFLKVFVIKVLFWLLLPRLLVSTLACILVKVPIDR